MWALGIYDMITSPSVYSYSHSVTEPYGKYAPRITNAGAGTLNVMRVLYAGVVL